jgi:Raf kinase inhibitor-like YbhB/YbcL family protein
MRSSAVRGQAQKISVVAAEVPSGTHRQIKVPFAGRSRRIAGHRAAAARAYQAPFLRVFPRRFSELSRHASLPAATRGNEMNRANSFSKSVAAMLALSLGTSAMASAAEPFVLTSSSLKDGAPIPKKFAADDPLRTCTPLVKTICPCPGSNVSPQLGWAHAPAQTKSFAILMFDVDGQWGFGVSHWVAYGIPANVTALAEGEATKGSAHFVGGTGTRGGNLYVGPCPPQGDGPHHYSVTVMALDLAPAALKPGLTREAFMAAAKGHALASSSIGGTFGR